MASLSDKKHKSILKILDLCTQFCSAIPMVNKSNFCTKLTRTIDFKANQLGHYTTILYSGRGMEFTVFTDSGFRHSLWSDVLGVYFLNMNQLPTRWSKKSPYKLFKGASIPIKYFHLIGNQVVIYSNRQGNKLDHKGYMGKLIMYNVELKSYKIFLPDGCLVNSKNLKFLNFKQKSRVVVNNDGPFLEEKAEHPQNKILLPAAQETQEVKEEVEVNELDKGDPQIKTEDGDSSDDTANIEEILVVS